MDHFGDGELNQTVMLHSNLSIRYVGMWTEFNWFSKFAVQDPFEQDDVTSPSVTERDFLDQWRE
jgi:hypothetical protein